MRTVFITALVVAAVAAYIVLAGSSLSGVWEGDLGGVRAAFLTIREVAGKPEGRIVFYVVDQNAADPHLRIVGQVERRLRNASWDGRALRFRVDNADYTMTLTGYRKARLKRAPTAGETPLEIEMLRH